MKPEEDQGSSGSVVLVNETEAARRLSISSRTLQQMRLEGGGPEYVKVTERRIAYQPSALEDFARSRTRQNTSEGRKP